MTPSPATPTTPPAESAISLDSLWGAIRKGWLIIFVATASVGLAALFFTLGQTKIYEAHATILFDPQTPRPLGKEVQAVVDLSGEYLHKKEYYKTQFWVIQSQRIATLVVQQLGLDKDARFLDNLPASAKPAPRTVSVEDAARLLRSRLSVEQIRDSRLARVTYADADPVRAQRVLGVLVDTYTQNNLENALDAMNMAGDWLGNQVDSLKKELESNELALHDYKKEKNILSVSMDDQTNMLRAEIQQLNNALTTTRAQREQIAARRHELSKINPDDPSNIPATELLASELLQGLRSAYVNAVTARDALVAGGKGVNHPDVLSAQARVDATRKALMNEVKNVQGAVEHEYNVATHAINGLSGLLEKAKKQAFELNLLEIEYNRLKRNKETSEKLFGIVTERSKENDLTRLLRFNNLRVVDRPSLPRQPVSPNVPLNIAGGLALGLLIGLVGAIGRDQLDRSIKTPDDAERELNLSLLGVIPLLSEPGTGPQYGPDHGRRRRRKRDPAAIENVKPELVVHAHPTSGVAEAARALRTNILFMSPDRPYQVLLITSAAPAEGKTTIACHIAIAMAQAGKRVALLDCDMRRPRIHKLFGLDNSVGITSVLIDPEGLDQAIFQTEVPNLNVITTGPIPPNPVELLHSSSFERLLSELRSRFDSVIIDSPPVAPVTDAAVLSTRVDGTVIVVRSFKTRKDVARRAVRALRDVSGHLVGTVLNAVSFERRGSGYYQYYYYRKSGYEPETPQSGAVDRGSDQAEARQA